MKEWAIKPKPNLCAIVTKYYLVQGESGDKPVFRKLLPTYEILIIFSFGTSFTPSINDKPQNHLSRKGCYLTSLLKSSLTYRLSAKSDLLVINLSPEGFHRIFGVDPKNLGSDNIMGIEDSFVRNTFLKPLWGQLKLVKEENKRLELVNRTLAQKMSIDRSAFELVANGLASLAESMSYSGKTLAKELKLNERTVQLRFKKVLGYSAKELIRFKRFQILVKWLQENKDRIIDWSDMAVNFGYYDHSHLSRDFRFYLGTTAKDFLKDQDQYCIPIWPE